MIKRLYKDLILGEGGPFKEDFMVKCLVTSDFHVDVAPVRLFKVPDGVEAVIYAGDFCERWSPKYINYARELFGDLPIFAVAGNHEYYGMDISQDFTAANTKIQKNADDIKLDMTLFEKNMIRIGRHYVLLTTLWTDFNLFNNAPLDKLAARDSMNDYRRIRWKGNYSLTPDHTQAEHFKSIKWLEKSLIELKDKNVVVVTHNGPSLRSVPDWAKFDRLSAAFSSNLDEFILKHSNIKLWIHGHTHSNFDYMVGDTRVLANPHGYGTENPNWIPDLVIDL